MSAEGASGAAPQVVHPVAHIGGSLRVPGDKSVSHRALLFSALAHGTTHVTGLGMGGDVRSTRGVLEALGVVIRDEGTAAHPVVVVEGRGFEGLRAPAHALDCGNSGTTLRIMMGVLAGRPFTSTLIGDPSLSRRPMERVAEPLRRMGAQVSTTDGRPPITLHGAALRGQRYDSPVASAQVKSALLLAGLQAQGSTTVTEPALSRDHSERMLRAMGAALHVDGLAVTVTPSPLQALGRFDVPGDFSSAAFWLAAGLLVPGPGVAVDGALLNPTRTGFLDIVRAMGARVEVTDADDRVEPVGRVVAHHGALNAVDVGGDLVVRAIDEVPILAVLATQARGTTIIRDAGELRVKESDRLAVMARTLNTLGASVRERPDGLEIDGPTPLHGGDVDAHLDHRIAMSAAIAALSASGPVHIYGADAAAVSYPAFWRELSRLAPGSVNA